MTIHYEIVKDDEIECCRELCNKLMIYQKSKAHLNPEMFDMMNFDTRMAPAVINARRNFTVAAKDGDKIIGYVYSNISPKEIYSNDFVTFFDLETVDGDLVGCLNNFYLENEYRNQGIGTVLFDMSMNWLKEFSEVKDYFVFVSNGNDEALKFYKNKGFIFSNEVLDGFITALRYPKQT